MPEQNKGWIIILIRNVVEGKLSMDVLGFFKLHPDPRDMDTTLTKLEKFQMELVDIGKAVTITEPTAPFAFTANQKEIEAAEDKSASGCKMTTLALKSAAAAIMGDASRQIKVTKIHLPAGMVGCNDYLNGKVKLVGNGNRIQAKGRFIPFQISLPKKGMTSFLVPYVFWKVPIAGTVTLADQEAATDCDDMFDDAINSMLK